MRVLLSALHFGFLRNFEPVLRELAARGHDLHLVADRRDALGGERIIDGLAAAYPGRVTWELVSGEKDRLWHRYAQSIRGSIDYLRYLHPRYNHAKKLSARAAAYASWPIRQVGKVPSALRRPIVPVVEGLLRALEAAVPPRASVEAVLDRVRPDLLLLTPLLYFGCQQVDYVRAARRRGIPTALGVGSWDHLTTKGAIHEIPDRVIVWNHAQAAEAVELHAVPPDRIVVTGAQAYDHWFARRPTLSREAFFERVGLAPDRPMVLYLCSSPFIAPHEVGFVRRWVEALRRSPDPLVRSIGVLIRPHPQNAAQWDGVDVPEMPGVALWPRGGANPIDELARSDYYHSMYFSRAVVGINTSAQVESSILGRPVLSVLEEEFNQTQEGTLHFQHLHMGLLRVARNLDEHVRQLAGILHGDAGPDPRSEAFVLSFVRPHGRDVVATGVFVEALERLTREASGIAPTATPMILTCLRAVSRPLASAWWLAARARGTRKGRTSAKGPHPPEKPTTNRATPPEGGR